MLIVGCGCRGRELAAALAAEGHVARGTTRSPDRVPELERAGVEGRVADPDRLGSVLAAVDGVAVVVWLLAGASGPTRAAVHGPRLGSMLERIVDTPVRGFIYEDPGPGGGRELVDAAARRWRIPVRVVPAGADAANLAAAVAELVS